MSNNMVLIKKKVDKEDGIQVKTSLTLDQDLYTEFSIEAKRRHTTTSKLMEHAMRLVLKEGRGRK